MEVCYSCFGTKITSGPCPHCGYDPTGAEQKYPLALRPGSILNGRYVVGRVLGQGGFGITYVALDDHTGQRVAIKEYLPTDFAGRPSGTCLVSPYSAERLENFRFGKERFLEEAKTLAAFIGDEHIVRIYSYFEENGTAYFAMEYIEGLPLNSYMATRGGRLTVEEADELLLPIMDALDTVHAKGIVHRDIAPDNIIITPEHKAKLLDFGAARYSTGEKSKSLDVVIKHGFAPKEQYLRRGRQGPFTDVYAMAATYYYAITGRIPPESIGRMEEDDLVPPSSMGVRIGAGTEDVLFKALEVSSADRYQTMGAFRAALAAADAEERGAAEQRQREDEERRRQEEEAAEQARLEQERLAREAEERSRLEREAAEKARAEQERREKEAAEKAQKEQARQEKEAAKKARTEPTPPVTEPAMPAPRKKGLPILPLIAAALALIGAVVFFAGRSGKQAEPSAGVPDNGATAEAATVPAETGQPIPDGDYLIVLTQDQNMFLDIPGTDVPAKNEENVWVCQMDSHMEDFDYWTLHYIKELGVYELFQMNTDMALDVYYAGTEPGTNIQVCKSNGTVAQKWYIEPFGDGWRLRAMCSDLVLEIANGNAQLGPATSGNGTQCWTFIPYGSSAVISAETSQVTSPAEDLLPWKLRAGVLTISGWGPMEKLAYGNAASVRSVVIENGVTSISESAFSGYSNLESVSIPEGVVTIGSLAFYGCNSLKSVVLPESVRVIHFSAFEGCQSLTEISIPEGVTSISDSAFAGCYELTKVTIPGSVTSIDGWAFDGCGSLKTVNFTGTQAQWSKIRISEGNDLLKRARVTFNAPVIHSAGNLTWTFNRGVLTISGQGPMEDYGVAQSEKAPWHEYQKSINSVVIESGVTTIGSHAFFGYGSLKKAEIPGSVTGIGDQAFYSCKNLAAIVLPESLMSIGDSAFYGCAFRSVIIPKHVRDIGAFAFMSCANLTNVTISKSVTHIARGAFDGSSLRTVKYAGSQAAWEKINIEGNNGPLTSARIIFG